VGFDNYWWWNNGGLLGPFSIQQFGDFHWIITSGIKVTVALVLVVIWILILSKLKNYIFKKELKF
jgi:hypothetical protein